MKLVITKEASKLLYHILWNPYQLPLTAAGRDARTPLLPYKAEKSKERRMIRRLREWLKAKLNPELDKNGNPTRWEWQELNTGLRQAYVDQLVEMMEWYKTVGALVEWCDAYEELHAALKGETIKDEDPEDRDPIEDEEGSDGDSKAA